MKTLEKLNEITNETIDQLLKARVNAIEETLLEILTADQRLKYYDLVNKKFDAILAKEKELKENFLKGTYKF